LRLYAALLAIVLIAYGNAFGLGFALDGRQFAIADTRTQAATADNIRRIFETDYWWPRSQDPLYRPATTLSFLVNYSALGNGPRPFGYHAVNILLLAGNVFLVFALGRRLFRQQMPAFFAATIWAVHPVGVETVTNVAGRADLLAGIGMLGALAVYASAPRRYWAIFPLAALAAFSKETGAMLIGLLLLWDVTPGLSKDTPWRRRLPGYAAAFAAVAVYTWMRYRVLASVPTPVPPFVDNPLRGADFLAARWTAVKMVGMDLLLLVWPVKLSSDRAYAEIVPASFADPAAWASLLVVAAMLAAVIARRRKEQVLFWAAGFFGLTLLPSSNLVVLIGATMAERFLYLPAIGFAVALSAVAYRFAPRHAAVGLGIVAALFAARTIARNPDWDNEIALMSKDAETAPRSFRVHDTLGEFLYAADPRNLHRAIAELEKAWEILAPLPPERNTPQIPGALATYYILKAGTFPPGSAENANWHRKALPVLVRADEILRAGEKAFDERQAADGKPVQPRRPSQQLYLLLGDAHAALRNSSEAYAAYRHGRGIAPAWPVTYEREALARRSAGDVDGAARLELQKAFALGLTPPALLAVEQAYAGLPGGSCAVTRASGIPLLNTDCPRLRSDLCAALPELASVFADARQPDRSAGFLRTAAQYGCAGGR
jgi:hypothetical protein